MKITIDNRDLSYTIDTYGMFTGESTHENEAEYYHDEYGMEYEDIEFDYDHKGIVKDLATASVGILWQNLKGDIVKDINLEDTKSPSFYNYTTDSYRAVWDIDREKLEAYVKERQGEYNSFERENWYAVYDSHGTDDFKEDDYTVAMLDFYTSNEYDREDYESEMFEHENEIYYENMQLTNEADTKLKKLQEAK